jgi:dUTPase
MSNPIFKFALREDLNDNPEFLPARAHDTDTGYDVRAAQADRKLLVIKPFQYAKIPLGFRGLCPEGYWYKLVPRSSTFGKKSLHALYGTVDESYEGELVFACQYIPTLDIKHMTYLNEYKIVEQLGVFEYESVKELTINFGDAIGQLIPVKRQDMDVVRLSNEELDAAYKARGAARGAGGFGSTGA